MWERVSAKWINATELLSLKWWKSNWAMWQECCNITILNAVEEIKTLHMKKSCCSLERTYNYPILSGISTGNKDLNCSLCLLSWVLAQRYLYLVKIGQIFYYTETGLYKHPKPISSHPEGCCVPPQKTPTHKTHSKTQPPLQMRIWAKKC